MGNVEKLCVGYCVWLYVKFLKGIGFDVLLLKVFSGDVGVDGMIINIVSLFVGVVINFYVIVYF